MNGKDASLDISSDEQSTRSAWQTRKEVIITVVSIALVFTLGLAVSNGISALLSGEIATASNYASFASGLATMVLVGITGWYTYVTRQLVHESRRTRIQEQKRAEQQQKEELKSLRKSFLHEIKTAEEINEVKDRGKPVTIFRNVAPVQVYANNADKIGMLTEQEIKHITEYYGNIHYLKDLFFAVREGDYDWESSEDAIHNTVDRIARSQQKSVKTLEEELEEED